MFRKLFITLIFLFVFVTFVYYFSGLNFLKLNDSFKEILIEKVQSVVNSDFSVDKLNIRLGSIELNDVKLVFQDAPYEIDVTELRLGYSLPSLLKGKFDLEKAAEEITIYKPKFILHHDPAPQNHADVDLSLKLSDNAEQVYRSIIKNYDFIKKITVSDGTIIIRDAVSQKDIQVAQKINGWVYTDSKGQAWVRMAGHLFESDAYNMVMYGQLDLRRGGIDYMNVDLHDYQIGNEIPFLPDYFEVLYGSVDGHLTVTERIEPTRGFNIVGSLNLKNGGLKLARENLYFEDINLKAEVKDWNLEIKSASQTINGSPTILTGKIKNILDPEFDLRLTSDKLYVHKFLSQFAPQKHFPFTGATSLDLFITETVQNPKIHGSLRTDSLQFFDRTLKDLEIDLNFNNYVLNFPKVISSQNDATLSGHGQIDFHSPEKLTDFKVNVVGTFTNEFRSLGFDAADRCVGNSEISIFGPLLNAVSTGDFNLYFTKEGNPSLEMNGSFKYSLGRFQLNTSSTNAAFQARVSIDSVFTHPFYNIDVRNFEKLFSLMNDPKYEFLNKHYALNLSGDGYKKNLHLTVVGFNSSNEDKLFKIETQNQFNRKEILGKITLLPNDKQIPGSFVLSWNRNKTKLTKFKLGDWVDGSFDGTTNNGSATAGGGSINISGLPVPILLHLLCRDYRKYEGALYGQIEIDREDSEPSVLGRLWLMEGFLGQLGPMTGELAFKSQNNTFTFKKIKLENSESLDVNAEGSYDYQSKYLNLKIKGTHVPVADVLNLFTDTRNVAKGDATVQISLKGRFPKVPLYGHLVVQDAKILMLGFDEAVLDFGDEHNWSGAYFSSDELYFSNTTLKKNDEFVLQGDAHLPFKGERDLNVRLSGDGNFLAILPDLANVFRESQSIGHLDLHLGGHYEQPDFTGSTLSFKKGTLYLSSVAKKIENMQGELAVLQDDYFLDIRKLSGTIHGEPISISNSLATIDSSADSLNPIVYDPLHIAGDDLNLGLLTVHTSDKGVLLNIPGLMEGGELGWYAFEGKTPKEDFHIAGPWLQPVVRGTIKIHNANLTYPFDESTGEADPIVRNILDNINWDVVAVSDNDTRYVKQFPTGIYVNMEVDKDASHLDFSGSLKDSTFEIYGTVESQRGEIEYFDLNFRVERVGAEFNRSSLYPIVYGRAWTVVRDSTNVPSDVYLTLYTVDDISRQEVDRGPWDRIHVKLSSEYPGFEETQADLMASLGYSSDNIDEQARKAVGHSTDNLLFRPIMRPIERQLERKLQLDVVRFSYSIAQNFLDSSFNNEQLSSSLELLRSSRLILGKYLTEDLYLIYTGELKAGIDYQFQEKGVGLQHIVGLEYRLNPRWLLQMEYDYNTLLETHKDDKKVWLRHSFPF